MMELPWTQLIDPASYGYSPVAGPIAAVALLSLVIGLWVVIRERGRRVALSFLATTLALALYLTGFSLMVRAADPGVALFWGKVAYYGVPFIVPGVFHFTIHLLGRQRERADMLRAAWLVALVYWVLAVNTNVLVAGVRLTDWGYITRLTVWNIPILIWSTFLTGVLIHDFIREHAEADPVQKARIRWFAIPLLIGCLGFADYGPSLGLPGRPIGFAFFPVFLISSAWAVARYHLPDLTPAFAADKIIATMAEPLLVCDITGRIAIANDAACRLLDYPKDDLVRSRLTLLFGPGQTRAVLGAVMQEREMAIHAQSGDRIAVSVSTSRLVDRQGHRIATVVVARDIRERKRAAEALRRREEHYRALIENALDTITIVDDQGTISYQSPAVREVLGYDTLADIGQRLVDRIHEEDRPRFREMFNEMLEHSGASAEGEARIEHARGGYRIFELRGTNLLAHPAVRGVVLNGRDITEERLLEEQLHHAQKMEAIGRLAGGVAHDFNNILTAIHGYVALMQEEVEEGTVLASELDEVRRGAERAARLTDQLLAFSRRQVVRPEVLDVNEVVLDMRTMLERLIGEKVRLETVPADDLGRVRADRGHLEQVLLNLVVNAKDAMEDGGLIEVTTRNLDVEEARAGTPEHPLAAGRFVVLTVSDEGHGMDEATRSRIFEPFFTTKGQGKGTGLGLSTVYGSVRQAGGYVDVQSAPGQGTTFTIHLPRLDDAQTAEADADAAAAPPEHRTAAPQGQGAGETVLVVEDEAPVRLLMSKILERRGYRVLMAEDGETAIAVARDHSGTIDLLIADLVMPGIGGREVAERLAASRPGLPTIFVSGYTADEVVRQGIVDGEHIFLPKPFTPDILSRKVREVIDARATSAL